MSTKLILCGGCGAKNRLPDKRIKAVRCGGCGKVLEVPGVSRSSGGFVRALLRTPLFYIVIAGLGFAAYYNLGDGVRKGAPTAPAVAQPVFNASPVPFSVGVVHRTQPGVAPFEILTRPGSNYYVKLVNTAGQTVLAMFVEGGRRFETEAPLGSYEMRYAAGKTWYGSKHLFGPDTVYAKADSKLNFTFDGSTYNGYTIELILQAGGNLSTSSLAPANF